MTPTQIQNVLDKISTVFPRSDLSPAEMQLFGERLDRLDLQPEQAFRVIEQHRFDHDKRSPALKALLDKLHGAVQEKAKTEGVQIGPRAGRLVDLYRSRDKFPSSLQDIEVARQVGRRAAQQWGEDAGRSHLVTMLREMKLDEIEMWRVAFEMFPDPEMQKRVKDRIVSTSRKYAEARKRMAQKTVEQMAEEAVA